MKVLFDHSMPFFLAHGGTQVQLEQTQNALTKLGIKVEPVRWWDLQQTGDIIHYLGRPNETYIQLAHKKGMRIIMAELLGGVGARSKRALALQRLAIFGIRRVAPKTLLYRMAWESYQLIDACIALTPWEAYLMQYLFSAPKERIHVVPNGVEAHFFRSAAAARGQWLVCTSTITEVKRILEASQAAVLAQTPLWVIGNPYAATDPYAQAFFSLVKQHPRILRYEGAIYDREKLAGIYREARGFIMLSQWESLSLSALEAAACQCPLLLSDLPWARSIFNKQAMFCPISSPEQTAPVLKEFYEQAPKLPTPDQPKSWEEVAQNLVSIYNLVLSQGIRV